MRSELGTISAPVLMVGAGRVRHGDDAVGLLVARLVARRLAGHVALLLDLGGWSLLDSLDGRRGLIVVDAALADAESPVGSWRRIDFRASPNAIEACGLRDTHTANVADMLRMAQTLGKLPEWVWVYAIAGERFSPEVRMSAAVRGAVSEVVRAIEDAVRACAGA